MKIMAHLGACLLILLISDTTIKSQNWAPLNDSDRYDYALGLDPMPQFHIEVDSTTADGGVTVWHLPTWPAPCDTCTGYDPSDCNSDFRYYPGLPQFLQKEVRDLGGGVFEFSDTGSFFIESWAEIGDSWTFDPVAGISATVSTKIDSSIFGSIDSVKTVLLSTGAEILLSKAHGILYFPASLIDGTIEGYRLRGIYGRNLGNYIPGWKELYNIQPGDKIQYLDYFAYIESPVDIPTTSRTTVRIRNYLERTETDSSIQLIFEENWQTENRTHFGFPPTYEISYGSLIDSILISPDEPYYELQPYYRGAGLGAFTTSKMVYKSGLGFTRRPSLLLEIWP